MDINKLSKIIEQNPDSAEAYFNRGVEYYSRDDFLNAYNDFTEAIVLNPDYAEAYCFRASCYRKNDKNYGELKNNLVKITDELNEYEDNINYDRAIADLNKSLEINPDYEAAYFSRGCFYMKAERFYEAIGDFTKVIEYQPDNYHAYNNRGFAYITGFEDNENALKDYSMAIKLNPVFAQAYFNRGGLYAFEFKIFEKALKDYNKVIDIAPENADAYLYLGLTYFKTNDIYNALKNWKRAYELGCNEAKKYIDKYCK